MFMGDPTAEVDVVKVGDEIDWISIANELVPKRKDEGALDYVPQHDDMNLIQRAEDIVEDVNALDAAIHELPEEDQKLLT